jgi:hypothetical protein
LRADRAALAGAAFGTCSDHRAATAADDAGHDACTDDNAADASVNDAASDVSALNVAIWRS